MENAAATGKYAQRVIMSFLDRGSLMSVSLSNLFLSGGLRRAGHWRHDGAPLAAASLISHVANTLENQLLPNNVT